MVVPLGICVLFLVTTMQPALMVIKPSAAISQEDNDNDKRMEAFISSDTLFPDLPTTSNQLLPKITQSRGSFGSGLGPDSIGPGLHVEIATGNVFTELPICDGVTIRYNSLKYLQGSVLGKGWTHSCNIYLEEEKHDLWGMLVGVTLVRGDGLEVHFPRSFNGIDGEFRKSYTEAADLVTVNDHYELHYFDGSKTIFCEESMIWGKYHIEQLIDSHGLVTRFEYNDKNLLSKIIDGYGRTIHFLYNNDNKLQYIIDKTQELTQFSYEVYDNGQILNRVVDPNGNTVIYGYSQPYGYPLKLNFERLKNSVEYHCEYVKEMNMEKRIIRDSNGDIITHIAAESFPDRKRVPTRPGDVFVTDGEGHTWIHERNRDAQRTRVISPDGYTHEVEYNRGKICRESNALGHIREYSYDSWTNLRVLTDERGETITYMYYNHGYNDPAPHHLVETMNYKGDEYRYEYDLETCRVTKIIDPEGNELVFLYEYYEPDESLPDDLPDDKTLPNRVKTITRIDRNGQCLSMFYTPFGELKEFVVDPDSLELRIHYEYDPNTHYLISEKIQRDENEFSVTNYTYDTCGRVIEKIVDPEGLELTTSWEYQDDDNTIIQTDPKGVQIKMVFDHRNRLDRVIEDVGGIEAVTDYGYDLNDNLVSLMDAEHHETLFEYDKQNWCINITDPEGFVTSYKYSPVGTLKKLTQWMYADPDFDDVDEERITTEFIYDKLGRVTDVVIDPEDLALTFSTDYNEIMKIYPDEQQLISYFEKITDARGNETSLLFDALGNLEHIVRHRINADDIHTQFEYDGEGNLKRFIGPENEIIDFIYDNANRLKEIRKDPDGFNLITEYEYDDEGNLIKKILPNTNEMRYEYDMAGRLVQVSDSLGLIREFDFDDNDNLVLVKNAQGHEWINTYDNLNRVTQSFDPSCDVADEYEYFDNGMLKYHTDKNGVVTEFAYYMNNMLRQTIEDAFGSDDSTRQTTTTYDYNGLGDITKLIDDRGFDTKYFYDTAGRHKKTEFADGGEIIYDHDENGNIIQRKDQMNQITEYTFDELNRLTQVLYPEQTNVYSYDDSSRLKTASNENAAWVFDYDTLGRLNCQSQDGATTEFDYEVGPESTVTITYPKTYREVVKTYDVRNRLADITTDSISSSYHYTNLDQIKKITRGNDISTLFSYDPVGRVTSIHHFDDVHVVDGDSHQNSFMNYNANLADAIDAQHINGDGGMDSDEEYYHDVYGYDNVGNRVYTRKLHDSVNSELFSYDALNRLVDFERGELNDAGDDIVELTSDVLLHQHQLWTLDSNGNWIDIVTFDIDGDLVEEREPNEVNEYVSYNGDYTTYDYDDNGNLESDEKYDFEYDTENRLVKIKENDDTVFEARYGPLGNRVTTIVEEVEFTHFYLGSNEIVESFGTIDIESREFIYDDTGLMALIDRSQEGDNTYPYQDEVIYYHKDVLGSTVLLTDVDGEIKERYWYELYGETVITGSSKDCVRDSSYIGNPYMWTGQRYQAETELYLFFGRVYEPHMGRWLSRDPLGYVDGMNLYEYVRSNPMINIDPLGFSSDQVHNEQTDDPDSGEPGDDSVDPGPIDDQPPFDSEIDDILEEIMELIEKLLKKLLDYKTPEEIKKMVDEIETIIRAGKDITAIFDYIFAETDGNYLKALGAFIGILDIICGKIPGVGALFEFWKEGIDAADRMLDKIEDASIVRKDPIENADEWLWNLGKSEFQGDTSGEWTRAYHNWHIEQSQKLGKIKQEARKLEQQANFEEAYIEEFITPWYDAWWNPFSW